MPWIVRFWLKGPVLRSLWTCPFVTTVFELNYFSPSHIIQVNKVIFRDCCIIRGIFYRSLFHYSELAKLFRTSQISGLLQSSQGQMTKSEWHILWCGFSRKDSSLYQPKKSSFDQPVIWKSLCRITVLGTSQMTVIKFDNSTTLLRTFITMIVFTVCIRTDRPEQTV